ncbi:hypothetical protein CPLU01_14887 [Colletotrichum plurivorum]|uniref:Thyroglobulin type-1 domain-containing protein n=1 Tax=Colletotrichum plurivorum TaxID=2175906 RepID=A0A8H6MY43_9PEZI|nr:hypothetical protein CPLU01_14887 [Colletotrichum plurivorum]
MFFLCKPRQPPQPPPLPRPYCRVHGCTRRVLKCEPNGKGKGGMILSHYCKDREFPLPSQNRPDLMGQLTSFIDACRQRLENGMCPNEKELGMTKFCEDRTSESCKDPRVCADSGQDYPYCIKHTCYLSKCHHKRSPSSMMCDSHTPKCLIPNCGQPRSDSGLYCPAHSCNDDECNGVISGGNWCKDHRLCRKTGCDQPRAVTPGGKCEDVCWKHLPTACRSSGCTTLVSGGVKLCGLHKCTYPPCLEPKDNGKDVSRIYCASHTCEHPSCPQPISNPSDPSTSRYCITHTCKTPTCSQAVKPGNVHCAIHACYHATCTSPRPADALSFYCASHTCRAAGCHGQARSEGGYCAATHACGVPGCPGLRTSEDLCTSHSAAAAAAGYTLYHHPPPPTPAASSVGPAKHTTYIGPTEEALGLRLREERERMECAARLDREMRAWEAAARGGGVHVDRRSRAERMRSCDSGMGLASPSDYTLVS